MKDEYSRIYNVQETLDYFHININEPVFMELPLPIHTIQIPCRDTGTTSPPIEVKSFNIGLTPIGISAPITPVDYNNCIQDTEYIDQETNFMIPDRNSYFKPIKLSKFDYPLTMIYNKKLNQFHHFHNKHDCYYIVYKYNPNQSGNRRPSYVRNLVEKYMKKFPKDAFYIQKLDFVIHHTIILNEKD